MLNREQILRALIRLAAVLESRGVQGELYLVGGAAIALAYDARRATRDVDAVFAPKQAVYEAAQVVAEELNLPENWLNDAVKLYLRGEDPEPLQPLDLPGLRVLVASPRYLLALKLLASRREDEQDIRTLLNLLQIQSVDEALEVLYQSQGQSLQLPPSFRFPPLREGNRVGRVGSVPPACRGNLKEGVFDLACLRKVCLRSWYY